jgi:hypothetical protein
VTAPSVIPASTTLLTYSATAPTMPGNATGAGVGNGDTIVFSAFQPATASTGTEPAITAPAASANTGVIITFPTATPSTWGTIVGVGIYDASTSGNLLLFDYLGNFKWLPATGTSASPSVITLPAHGFSNGDQVVVTQKDGGTLPTTAGSWSGLLTVANVTTDTFTAGVNTSATGDMMVRKVATQVISNKRHDECRRR